jgi:hypothetical protein
MCQWCTVPVGHAHVVSLSSLRQTSGSVGLVGGLRFRSPGACSHGLHFGSWMGTMVCIMHIYIYIYIYTSIYIYIYIYYIYICIHTCYTPCILCVLCFGGHLYIYTHIHTYTHTYTHIHTYIHTHIHT